MRKIKIDLRCKVPSWNYCNHDGPTPDMRFSKELCRFCVSTKAGCYCALHDAQLMSDKYFVHKTPACIDATAGFAVSVDEAPTISVDPKEIINETIKSYNKLMNDLLKQGYPRNMAEVIATKYMTGDK